MFSVKWEWFGNHWTSITSCCESCLNELYYESTREVDIQKIFTYAYKCWGRESFVISKTYTLQPGRVRCSWCHSHCPQHRYKFPHLQVSHHLAWGKHWMLCPTAALGLRTSRRSWQEGYCLPHSAASQSCLPSPLKRHSPTQSVAHLPGKM